ncbi:MAG TPA: V-type ATP synthase subunit F [Anaeromyxobacteraceae bacterium]
MAATPSSLLLHLATRPGDALGFRLAGAAVTEVPPGDERAALARLQADPRLGVLAVERRVLDALPPEVAAPRRDGRLPVLIPFDLPRTWGEAGGGRAYVAAIVRRAVGYHVKLPEEGSP